MLIIPPKEIMKNVDFGDNTVLLKGNVTEEQRKIFEDFKKKVEEANKHRFD